MLQRTTSENNIRISQDMKEDSPHIHTAVTVPVPSTSTVRVPISFALPLVTVIVIMSVSTMASLRLASIHSHVVVLVRVIVPKSIVHRGPAARTRRSLSGRTRRDRRAHVVRPDGGCCCRLVLAAALTAAFLVMSRHGRPAVVGSRWGHGAGKSCALVGGRPTVSVFCSSLDDPSADLRGVLEQRRHGVGALPLT
jgi:hypothetical protein